MVINCRKEVQNSTLHLLYVQQTVGSILPQIEFSCCWHQDTLSQVSPVGIRSCNCPVAVLYKDNLKSGEYP